ncbi:hypothetical protein ACOME3_006287 [Neoechinorhynchus agilis]
MTNRKSRKVSNLTTGKQKTKSQSSRRSSTPSITLPISSMIQTTTSTSGIICEDKATEIEAEFFEKYPAGSEVDFLFRKLTKTPCGIISGRVILHGVEYFGTICPPKARDVHFAKRVASMHNRKKAQPVTDNQRCLRNGKHLPNRSFTGSEVDKLADDEAEVKCAEKSADAEFVAVKIKTCSTNSIDHEQNASPIERLTCLTSSKIDEMFAHDCRTTRCQAGDEQSVDQEMKGGCSADKTLSGSTYHGKNRKAKK